MDIYEDPGTISIPEFCLSTYLAQVFRAENERIVSGLVKVSFRWGKLSNPGCIKH